MSKRIKNGTGKIKKAQRKENKKDLPKAYIMTRRKGENRRGPNFSCLRHRSKVFNEFSTYRPSLYERV